MEPELKWIKRHLGDAKIYHAGPKAPGPVPVPPEPEEPAPVTPIPEEPEPVSSGTTWPVARSPLFS